MKSIEVDGGNQTATVAFEAGESGDSHVLYYAWSNDGIDKGENIENWPNVLRTGRVADDATSATISLPAAAQVTAVYAARAFLATSSANYDYLVDGITSKVNTYTNDKRFSAGSYVDTGFKPFGGKTTISADFIFNSTNVQQYLLGATTCEAKTISSVSYGEYLTCIAYINGSDYYAYSFDNATTPAYKSSGVSAAKLVRTQFFIDGTASPTTFTVTQNGDPTTVTCDNVATNDTYQNLQLFRRVYITKVSNKATPTYGNYASATMYSCSITNDGECVRYYLPAAKDGVYGLYDSVNDTFSPSPASSYPFSGGTNISYSVTSGDEVIGVSPKSAKGISAVFNIDEPTVEPRTVTSATGGSKAGVAPLTLTGSNNFGGTFTVTEGTLVADFGTGLASTTTSC